MRLRSEYFVLMAGRRFSGPRQDSKCRRHDEMRSYEVDDSQSENVDGPMVVQHESEAGCRYARRN